MTLFAVEPDWRLALLPADDPGDDVSGLMVSLIGVFERIAKLAAARPVTADQLIVVLVSRRMSCIYDMLVHAGMPEFVNCVVVSDRVLATGAVKWVGRDVVLCDDSLELGTSLARRFMQVAERVGDDDNNATHVTTLVALISDNPNEHIVRQLGLKSDSEGGPPRRPVKVLHEFSRRVTGRLYQSGTPYFTDFPLTKDLSVAIDRLKSLLASPRWETFEVTVPEIARPEQRSYTLFPTAGVAEELELRSVPSCRGLSQLRKVRLFTRPDPALPGNVLVRLVPIAVPAPMLALTLDQLLGDLAAELKPSTERSLNWDDWDAPAKHRLVQMYLSTVLLTAFWEDVKLVGLDPQDLGLGHINLLSVRHYFGPDYYDSVARAFGYAVTYFHRAEHPPVASRRIRHLTPTPTLAQTKPVQRVVATIVEGELLQPLPAPDERGIRLVTELWAQPICNLFAVIAEQIEQPQQEELRALDWPGFKRYLLKSGGLGRRVLDLGITLGELATDLCNAGSKCDERTLSLAIDIANDLGIAVPATTQLEPNGIVYRHYRPGESAFIAWSDLLALARMPVADALRRADPIVRGHFGLRELPPDADIIELLATDSRVRQFARFYGLLQKHVLCLPEPLKQLWKGRVVGLDDDHVYMDVEAVISNGGSQHAGAALGRGAFARDDADRVAVGDLIKWRVFDVPGQYQDARIVKRSIDIADLSVVPA